METTLGVVLLRVVSSRVLLVVFLATLDPQTLSISDCALREIRVLVLSHLLLFLLFTLPMSRWHGTGSLLTPVSDHLLIHLTVDFLQDRGMEDIWIMDSGCSRHMMGQRRWFSSLTPTSGKDYITFEDKGQGKVLVVGCVSVSEKFS